MKRSNRTLNYHNLYVEGFVILLVVIGLSNPLCYLILPIYLFWQRKAIRWEWMLIALAVLFTRYFVFTMNQDIKDIHDTVQIVDIDHYETVNRLTIRYRMHRYHLYVYDDNYQLGDWIILNGEVEPYIEETIPFGFNAYQYYLGNNVLGKIEIHSITYAHSGWHILSLRAHLITKVQTDHQDIVSSFVFGKDQLSDEYTDLFRDMNLIFLMQTTGLHAFVLAYILKKLMFYLDVSEPIQEGVILIVYGIITYLNGFTIGVVRLFLTQIFYIINHHFKLRLTPLDRLFIVCFIMILISFSWVYSIGFLMTFLILLTLELARDRYQSYHGYLKRLVMGILIVLACLPFTRSIHWILIMLLPILILYVTTLLYSLSYVICFTTRLDTLYGWLLSGLTQTVSYMNDHLLTWYLPALNEWQMILYYVIFAYLLYAYKKEQLIIRTSLLLGLFGYQVWQHPLAYDASVFFLDVGQGDTTYIETPTCRVMIDSFEGSSDFLKNRGVYQLDYLFLTHSDSDHTKEAAIVIHEIGANQVVVNPYDTAYQSFTIPVTKAYANQTYGCGDLTFDILGPLYPYDETNENSLVIAVKIAGDRYLFTGDISQKVEKDLISTYQHELKSDILKIAHHGSNTSTSKDFLAYVNPSDAMIMVGRKNRFDFPHEETLYVLQKNQIRIHRTDQAGTIMIV